MPDRPILTIAIPVFNGQKNLKLTLHSIFDENELSNEFEVLVSDNASIDDTAAILNEYRDRYSSHLRTNTNSTNIGYDKNIDILVQHANGIYVWFIGCGEVIASGSIFNILSHLRKEYFDTIVLNFDVYEEATKKYDKKLSYPDYEVQITADKNDFSFPRYCPAVSANIVNREKWLAVSINKLDEIGWCHIERILDMIASKDFGKSLFIPEKSFTLYRDSDGWWTKNNSYLLLLALKHIRIIRSMPKRGFSKATSKSLEDELGGLTLWRAVLQSKSFGMKFNLGILKSMIQMFKHKIFFWAIVFPTLFVPSFLLVFARKLRRSKSTFLNV